ncbi:hypothetical protein JY651_32690 [Pyxidicoccus parkwayensis]|uniref:DUF3592 domain-containing protein n=1 Tax=Pyxidicoccus parkwayensis TaxID=2813578 RepID=A0ABX7NML8_9BACT|nr:hypothetical protein [Pyxidicoccus parkwaysis]QSQ20015.1 hypothetical protein JY651_32690 [Pyxidicoccus parkwaysis]
MHYELVFDAGNQPPQVGFLLVGVLFMVLGALLWRHADAAWPRWLREAPGPRERKRNRIFGAFFFGFALLWTTAAGISILGRFSQARSALNSGDARVVEGFIENFDPMPYSDHKHERFTVSGVPFEYSDYVVSPGFNQTRSHGGPLYSGLWVRLTYADIGGSNVILRAEVAPPPYSTGGSEG